MMSVVGVVVLGVVMLGIVMLNVCMQGVIIIGVIRLFSVIDKSQYYMCRYAGCTNHACRKS